MLQAERGVFVFNLKVLSVGLKKYSCLQVKQFTEWSHHLNSHSLETCLASAALVKMMGGLKGHSAPFPTALSFCYNRSHVTTSSGDQDDLICLHHFFFCLVFLPLFPLSYILYGYVVETLHSVTVLWLLEYVLFWGIQMCITWGSTYTIMWILPLELHSVVTPGFLPLFIYSFIHSFIHILCIQSSACI